MTGKKRKLRLYVCMYIYISIYMYVHALTFHLLTRKPLSQVSETHARDTFK